MADENTFFTGVVAQANLAPSVHNTQPTRWRLGEDNILTLLLDTDRLLNVGDPQGSDARLSVGTALEGTRIALGELGLTFGEIDYLTGNEGSLQKVLRVQITPTGEPTARNTLIQERFTWRGGFLAPKTSVNRALATYCAGQNDALLVNEAFDLDVLANQNDETSLNIMRDKSFRRELLHWMRLAPSHGFWGKDGMSADALCMSKSEAFGAKLVLRSPVFEMLDVFSMARGIVSEKEKTLSATGVVLFHRSVEEDPVESGAAFYQLWLGITKLGLSAWPMAALADDPDAAEAVTNRFNLPDDRRLINLLRVGLSPADAAPKRARLDPKSLIV